MSFSKKYYLLLPIIIIFVLFIYSVIDFDNGEIVEILPDKKSFKIKPEYGTENLINEDISVYKKLSRAKSSEKIRLMPEPEKPILVENSYFSKDVFSVVVDSDDNSDQSKTSDNSKKLEIISVENNEPILKKEKINRIYYHSQLVFTSSERDAENEFQKIKKIHSKILKNYDLKIVRINKDKKVFFQIFAGKFENFKDAKLLCKKFISEKRNCIVVKNDK